MAKEIKTIEEVKCFLKKVYSLAPDETRSGINNRTWVDNKVNKTQAYMAESGVTGKIIREVVSDLKVQNYSSTKDDTNPNFQGEKVWEFGITENLVDKDEDFYIKLKIREIDGETLLIMSFHPEQPSCPEDKLEFPYDDYED